MDKKCPGMILTKAITVVITLHCGTIGVFIALCIIFFKFL